MRAGLLSIINNALGLGQIGPPPRKRADPDDHGIGCGGEKGHVKACIVPLGQHTVSEDRPVKLYPFWVIGYQAHPCIASRRGI
jgi:hypothetical protein